VNHFEFFQKAKTVPYQKIDLPLLKKADVELIVRRDDLLDAELSGNKFYKLLFNLEEMKCKNFRRLLTFGGAYSNHIHATAAAGKRFGFDTIGLIRGEKTLPLNPCLADAVAWGMHIEYLSREDYKRRYNPDFQTFLQNKYDAYLVPEGGANLQGAKGMQQLGALIGEDLGDDFTSICLASGTGTSLAGIAAGILETKPVYGFSVLKGAGSLARDVSHYFRLLKQNQNNYKENWRLISGFHAGGYAKRHPLHLREFCTEFEMQTGILLDPVYTLKLFWGICCLIQQGFWPKGSRIVAIHSGGLQGRRDFD